MAASVDLWHHRLGHPHTIPLSYILASFQFHVIMTSIILLFVNHVNKENMSVLRLAHLARFLSNCYIVIFGHHHTLVSRFKYYLVLLDDFTHFA
jgi:hypothetical protein